MAIVDIQCLCLWLLLTCNVCPFVCPCVCSSVTMPCSSSYQGCPICFLRMKNSPHESYGCSGGREGGLLMASRNAWHLFYSKYKTTSCNIKVVDLYSTVILVPHTQCTQVQITQFYLQITPYLEALCNDAVCLSVCPCVWYWHTDCLPTCAYCSYCDNYSDHNSDETCANKKLSYCWDSWHCDKIVIVIDQLTVTVILNMTYAAFVLLIELSVCGILYPVVSPNV